MEQVQFPHSSPDTLEKSVAETADANKLSKEEVYYRDAGNSKTRCATCNNFVGGGISGSATCRVVAGIISPDGLSDYWTPRAKGLEDLVKVAK